MYWSFLFSTFNPIYTFHIYILIIQLLFVILKYGATMAIMDISDEFLPLLIQQWLLLAQYISFPSNIGLITPSSSSSLSSIHSSSSIYSLLLLPFPSLSLIVIYLFFPFHFSPDHYVAYFSCWGIPILIVLWFPLLYYKESYHLFSC